MTRDDGVPGEVPPPAGVLVTHAEFVEWQARRRRALGELQGEPDAGKGEAPADAGDAPPTRVGTREEP